MSLPTSLLPPITSPAPPPPPPPPPTTTPTTSTPTTTSGTTTTTTSNTDGNTPTTTTTDTTTPTSATTTSTSTAPTTSTTQSGTPTQTTLTESSTMVTSSASLYTSDGRQVTTFVQVTTVIAPGTVVTGTAGPTSAKQTNNTGAIVGGVVGGIGGLLLLALLAWFLIRRRRKSELDEHFDGNFDPDHVSAATTGAPHHPPPAVAHHRPTPSLEAGRNRVDLNDPSPNMAMAGLGAGAAAATYAPSMMSGSTNYGAGGSSVGYPATVASQPPSTAHHLPQMSMSSQGHGYGAQYQPYGGGYDAAGYQGPYDQGAAGMSSAPLGAAAYYGGNEKRILSPPGQEVPHQGGQYYQGGYAAGPSSPTHTTNTSVSGSQYHPYVHGHPRAMTPEVAPSVITSSSGAGLAYAQSHTGSGSGTGSQAPMMSAKEREARGGKGPRVMNPNPEDDAGPSGGVVQHRDGGRVAEEEDEGRGPSEIPPAYDDIVKGT